MRELLEEAREEPNRFHDCDDGLLDRIDAALSAPEPDAMEMVKQVRAKRDYNTDAGSMPKMNWTLTDSEAAALIESHDKRVPRAMLEEIGDWAVDEYEAQGHESGCETMDAILEKYGYRAE